MSRFRECDGFTYFDARLVGLLLVDAVLSYERFPAFLLVVSVVAVYFFVASSRLVSVTVGIFCFVSGIHIFLVVLSLM